MKHTNSVLLAVAVCLVFCSTVPLTAQELIPATCYGGNREFRIMASQEMSYPENALRMGTEGDVIVRFIVDISGKVRDFIILQAPSAELSAEATRLFNMLLWKPAVYRGEVISTENELKFEFNIKKYRRVQKERKYAIPAYVYQPVDSSGLLYSYERLTVVPKPLHTGKATDLGSFISSNLKYPDAAMRQNISGKVKLFFVIEPSGRVSNVDVLEYLGAGCSEEAVRLIRELTWKPGQYGAIFVRTAMKIDITFSLPGGKDYEYFPTFQNNSLE